MTDESLRPAWSEQFTAQAIQQLVHTGPIADLTPEWAFGGSTGKGVRVAVVDSGVEYDHPAVGDSVRGGVVVEFDEDAENMIRYEPDDQPGCSSG
jgi:subtilisin